MQRKESLRAALSPVVSMLSEKLEATEHDIWTALFAHSRNAAFDEEMRAYFKQHHTDKGCKGKGKV